MDEILRDANTASLSLDGMLAALRMNRLDGMAAENPAWPDLPRRVHGRQLHASGNQRGPRQVQRVID